MIEIIGAIVIGGAILIFLPQLLAVAIVLGCAVLAIGAVAVAWAFAPELVIGVALMGAAGLVHQFWAERRN